TMDKPPFFLRGGRIDPSEKWLIYGANYSLLEKKEIESTYVYKHNLETNEMVCLAKPTKPTWLFPNLSKDGTNILYNRKEYHPKGEQMWVVDIDGNHDREILNFGKKARVFASWLPDSKRIVFLTDTKDNIEQKHYSLGIYNLESEEIIWVIDDPSRNIEDFSVPKIGNYFLVSEYEKSKERVSIFNIETMIETKLPEIVGSYYPIAPLSSKEWIGKYYSSTQPDDIIKFNIDNIDPMNFKSLTDVWKQTRLQKDDLTAAENFDWKSHDDVDIPGWLYKPKKPNGKTIIYVHGGPTAHSEDSINSEIQYFAKLGFTVLDPNYRGSTGYGIAFEDSIRDKGWGADEQEDILSGIKTMISRGIAVNGKVGITGTSYGGYSAWFGITKAPFDIVAASAPICGMTDLVIDYDTTRPDLRPLSAEMMGGTPEEVPERYEKGSPINYMQN
ncbi:MAG: S9 family peptidase, partial [Candidatus Heimdallarchaeota archaeon]|nr:S9 family peptidase [Candidatus Heimdallarchaeota archaeon]